MNVKKIGNDFEVEFCEELKKDGFWVHFINPGKSGSQPFDIIAAKNGKVYAFDCKTCADKWFRIDRLEDNQIFAFDKWMNSGNNIPMIAIKHNGRIFIVPYVKIKEDGKVNLEGDDGVYSWE